MSRAPALRAVGLALAALVASGCGSAELRALRTDIARSTPALQVGEGRSLSLGPLSLGLVRGVVHLGDDEDDAVAAAALRSLRRVQVAQYEVSGTFDPRTVPFQTALRRYATAGWAPVVVVRSEDEVLWVLTDQNSERIDEALVVTLSRDEIVLAKLRGDLTEVVRTALAQAAED